MTSPPPTESLTPSPSLNPSKTLTNFLCNFLLSRRQGRFTTAFIHECEGIGGADEALLAMGEPVSEKKVESNGLGPR
jgi:hypothetical protein